ncbi:pyruvate dehydrogenase (acetyl-transferring), homodimeric type [candidate division KSB1 bacterium]|nr:pyruvate dehydrogenase (acetyl-transferring), homodimeric type [candidate division KSB1 bacterium]RQW01259.1 MAG: pyruvate dehydrogenase (acetyl-transferring), homodimeric type [candidate division KSB1 bacterium]
MSTEDQRAIENIELQEWLESLDYVIQSGDENRVQKLLLELQSHAAMSGIKIPFTANTPYINTITAEEQPNYPGNREIERRIKSIIRWNAMAMVVRANRVEKGVGGHISTYASAATLYEVGFNHFFRGPSENFSGDLVYFQGHASPGIYSRAFLEDRLDVEALKNFRHECHEGEGLPSYPHPQLKPEFWQFPTVSMGLGPIMSIYQARFNRYLEDRGLKPPDDAKVWVFLGDGETDEPETLGAISLAAREKLDNLIFVINCNLQRLDGPVRGNGQIIQELERVFRGAGWNTIKVIWGSDFDPLLAQDKYGVFSKRAAEIVDGEYQNYAVRGGAYLREKFYGVDPRLLQLVEHLSDEQLAKMRLGGHDPEKINAAYKRAVEHKGAPTVILARTIKGYGLGEAGEGKNITHSQKALNEQELREFRSRFGIPISDDDIDDVPFYRPADDTPEIRYLQERRKQLGGYVPTRRTISKPIDMPEASLFEEFQQGTQEREVSTTMVFVRILSKLLKDKNIGKLVVPIVPDEARTFGMEALFRQVGIYAHTGQLYEPVDREQLLYYKEAKDGQILEEGITEAGAMSSFNAAGTAYSTHGVNTIPFYIYYSMFGLQRVGDLVWAAGDMRARGFLLGGTSGRTTLAGEGLQHQDGHSHLLAYPFPNLKAYDPAFAFELATIIEDGIKRMYVDQENVFYYLTVMNENYVQPAMPDEQGIKERILKGLYRFKSSELKNNALSVQLFGSGTILNRVLAAQDLLTEQYNVAADVWSATSYKELHNDAIQTQRWNMFHPDKKQKQAYVTRVLNETKGPIIAASDYVRALPESIAKWLPLPLFSLGTDGFGRSDGRRHLRDFFEVDERYITYAALYMLFKDGKVDAKVLKKALKDLQIDPEKVNPLAA